MKPIKDTFLFQMQDKSISLKSKMLSYDPVLDDVSIESIDEQLTTIKRRFNYPAKNIILDDISIRIKPIYNKDRITIPSYLPAYIIVNPKPTSERDRVIAIVNLTNHASKAKDSDLLNIDPKQLFCLLQAGEILLTCYDNWNSITLNQNICKNGALIYSRMFIKILDKMFAVNFDPIKADKIKFVASKFFLLNLLGRTQSETIDNMAYSTCTNGTLRNTINQFNEEFNINAYKRFDYFIQQIQLSLDGLYSLTVRTFIDQSLKMYGPSVVLAWEYFPMFIHIVSSVVIGARFTNESTLEPVLGKEADRLYNDFVGFMR